MNKNSKDALDLVIRYAIILFTGLGNLYIFYFFLTPLTLYTTYFILNLFGEVNLLNNSFSYAGNYFILVPACVGGSAFYLLLILNLSTREIQFKKRTKILIYSFLTLFLFNIFRILLMVHIYGSKYFDAVHWTFWYILSTLFVFFTWIFFVKLYKIQKIPVYSDIRHIYKSIKTKKKIKKKSKK